MSRLRVKHEWWPLLLVGLLAVPALQPLWQAGLQQTDDGAHHIFRLLSLDLALRSGHLGTRWLSYEGFGYGFPVLNFYAPLGYLPGLAFHLLGAGFVTSLELTIATGLILAALAMYAFARELLGSWGGALAAVAYTWAPYHLADAWTRGALAELLAFVWLPLLLLALWRSVRAEGRDRLWPILWGGMCLAGLILTHNLTVILAAPVLVAWGFLLLLVEVGEARARRRCLRDFIVMGLLGVALSAAFWLPALAESKYVWAGQVPVEFSKWAGVLTPPPHLIAETWAHRYTPAQGTRALHALGQAQVAVAALGLAVAIWRWQRLGRTARLALPLFVGLALLALFMQSAWSRLLWSAIPGLLLLQFPWRWQTVGVLTLAVVGGYAGQAAGMLDVDHEARRGVQLNAPTASTKQVALIALLALVLMSGALPNIPWERGNIPATDTPFRNENVNLGSMAMYDFGRGLWLREHGSDWMFEYMPVWVQVPRADFFLSAGPGATNEPPLAAQVILGRQTPLERAFRVTAPASWRLQLHQFYFPGWQASVDGQVRAATPTGSLGLAGIDVPAGEHQIVFRFSPTNVRRFGWALSLAGVMVWLAGMVWLRRWGWLLGIIIAALVFGGLAARQRLSNPTDYTPTAVSADFGNQVQLVGFYAPPERLRPGREATVILNWLALRRPAADYKVFVHLIDSHGKLWAQHDGEPVFFFSPTTRWQQGEVVEDRHVLDFQGEPPPGRYQLRAGLYNPATGQRLPRLGPDGAPVDDQILLAEFEIK
ncbi:MAG: hypothetical protein IT330_02050 [Anaerolineae bacterium]|nr:hypothetical protein [Anaerolineae bacterium]